MRYLIALISFAAILGCGCLLYSSTKAKLINELLMKVEGLEPGDEDTREYITTLKRGEFPSGDYQVSSGFMLRLALVSHLEKWWGAWVTAVLLGCIGFAYLIKHR